MIMDHGGASFRRESASWRCRILARDLGGRHGMDVLVDELTAERGLGRGDRGLEEASVPEARRTAEPGELVGVEFDDFIDGEEVRLDGHLAIFLNVASWASIARLAAARIFAFRAERTGWMMRRSPSVVMSSSVSRSMSSNSRMGF